MNSSSDPTVRASLTAADGLVIEIDTVRKRVETGANPRTPEDVDLLNSQMDLAEALPPLITLAYPAPKPPLGQSPVAVDELVKVTASNNIGVVSEIVAPGTFRPAAPDIVPPGVVRIKYIRPRSTLSGAVGFSFNLFGKEFIKYVDDPRTLYLGPTPKRTNPVGDTVKKRMQAEGKFRIQNGVGQILYSRDGKWWNESQCDMGHVIDAVTWWNSNGRLTGAQSSSVLNFMNNPINYELEPSEANRLRGSALSARGIRYLPPVK